MPSITYWNRVEPRPRARSIRETLSARLRDPLWLLTRQWQFGEFHGEDAASPAYVHLDATCRPLTAWRADGAWEPLDGSAPLEPLIEAEPFRPDDLSLQVELALLFGEELAHEAAIPAARQDALLAALRGALPLPAPPATDAEAVRFHRLAAPRSFDGTALFARSRAEPPTLPPGVAVDPADAAALAGVQRAFAGHVIETFGAIGAADPPAWRPDRLEYEGSIAAASAGETRLDFTLSPELDGMLDWYALDLRVPIAGNRPPARAAVKVSRSVLPGNVRFRGMPNARWWDFETSRTSFGDIRPDRRDVAKLVVMDFMLVHGNDWFVVPLEQTVGTMCRVDALAVKDVFGETTHVERAEEGATALAGRWTLYSTTDRNDPDGLGDYLVLPPSVSTALQVGPCLEDVRFFRDEIANVAWAVERTIEGGCGEPRPGAERSTARGLARAPAPAVGAAAALRYLIQTEVPEHWIPFVPVAIDPLLGDVALERAAMLDTSVHPPVPILPVGRILRPASLGAGAYRIREEELPRSGVRVRRVVCRSRWTDGSTWLWVARQKAAGGGEGWSGLRFDQAVKGP